MSEPARVERQSPWKMFVGDLSASARDLRTVPALIFLTLALHLAVGAYLLATDLEHRSRARCIEAFPPASCHPHPWLGVLGLIYFLVTLFLFGYYGTQRIWFLRAHRGQPFEGSMVWRISWSFFGRFMTLSFIGVLFILPAGIASGVWVSRHPGHRLPWNFEIIFYIVVFLLDVVGTFVGPALTFSTRRVWVAIPAGIKMLKRTWPQSFWYAIAPPLTVLVVGADFVRRSAGIASALVVTVLVGPLLGLWTKCATSLFYLRLIPDIGSDGAAFFPLRICRNSHAVEEQARFCPVCGVDVKERFYPS